jgi:hypothetical protein
MAAAAVYALAALALRFAQIAELDIPDLGTLRDPLLFSLATLAGAVAYLVKRSALRREREA